MYLALFLGNQARCDLYMIRNLNCDSMAPSEYTSGRQMRYDGLGNPIGCCPWLVGHSPRRRVEKLYKQEICRKEHVRERTRIGGKSLCIEAYGGTSLCAESLGKKAIYESLLR